MESKYIDILQHLCDDSFDYKGALNVVRKDLHNARNNHQEQQANNFWAIKTVIEIYQGMVDVYELLQQHEYYKAWCEAEQVEIMCNNLQRNSQDVFTIVKDLYECIIRLQGLYPYQIFCSYVIQIKKERCSICNQIRNIRHDCGHRRGYVSNGQFCCNIIEDFELKSIDIVDNPVHKYAVLFTKGKDGNSEDNYDYSLVEGLMQYWTKPFQHWIYYIKHIHKPLTDYPGLTDDDYCPCGSGKKYGECCKSDPEGVKHKVYQFRVEQCLL